MKASIACLSGLNKRRKLSMSLSTTDKARVSRIVRRMKEKLGAQLLARSTRRLSVTEVGRDYFERAVCILTAAEAAEAAVAQQSREPKVLRAK